MNLTETDADVQPAWIPALSDWKIDDTTYITPLENEFENHSNNFGIMMTIARSKMKGLTGEGADRVYAERTQAEVKTQIEETLVDMLQLGNNAASKEIKTASARFLETFALGLFNGEVANDVISEWFGK